MIPTPGQPTRHYGIGAVNYDTGETEVIFRRHKRRREIAEWLQRLLDKHPTGPLLSACGDNSVGMSPIMSYSRQSKHSWRLRVIPLTVVTRI